MKWTCLPTMVTSQTLFLIVAQIFFLLNYCHFYCLSLKSGKIPPRIPKCGRPKGSELTTKRKQAIQKDKGNVQDCKDNIKLYFSI